MASHMPWIFYAHIIPWPMSNIFEVAPPGLSLLWLAQDVADGVARHAGHRRWGTGFVPQFRNQTCQVAATGSEKVIVGDRGSPNQGAALRAMDSKIVVCSRGTYSRRYCLSLHGFQPCCLWVCSVERLRREIGPNLSGPPGVGKLTSVPRSAVQSWVWETHTG